MTGSADTGPGAPGAADFKDGWIYACRRDELGAGEKLEVTLPDGKAVLLVSLEDGKIVACCADCPHQGTPLVEGMIDRNVLICPTHFWEWDLTTGEPLGAAELPLPVFSVMEADGNLYLRFEPPF